MRLIINKALDNINDNVNLKIIEITSTDFLNNDLDYFVYKYQIPLIKFTDTEEIFNINNFKIELSSSLSETELILTESDLELLSGGGGGTQDLQSVLDNGGLATKDGGYSGIELFGGESGNRFFRFYTTSPNEKPFAELTIENNEVNISNNNRLLGSGYSTELSLREGVFTVKQISGEYNSRALFGFAPPLYNGSVELLLPSKPEGIYTLATLDDIKKIDLTGRVYENNAASISGGLTVNDVYRTSTGELRIVV